MTATTARPGGAAPPSGAPAPGLLGAAALAEGKRVARLSSIRDVVFGSQDGVLTTLALVTGVHGAAATRFTVLIAGLSGALAGTVSMALGAYIAGRSQRDLFDAELAREREQLSANFAVERRELAEILVLEGLSPDAAGRAAEALSEHPEVMLKTMAEKELGIPYAPAGSPLREGATMGVSFLLGAAVPVLPYFLLPVGAGLLASVGLALLVLFGIGVAKAWVTADRGLRAGLQVAGLGGVAALLAYAVGQLLPALLGVHPAAGG